VHLPSWPRRNILAVVALTASLFLAACDSNANRASTVTSTTSAPVSAPTTASTATTVAPITSTTTAALPPAPQPSPEAVSSLLIHAWEKGDRATAAKVATASAISVLFAVPYGGEVLDDRGCGSPGPNPVVCSWGPNGGASPTNPLYNITVAPTGADWYASTIVMLTTG
jgi:hypothetical protein